MDSSPAADLAERDELAEVEALPIHVCIDFKYQGRTSCCGERWRILDVMRRDEWWAMMACPACGDVHALPLSTESTVVLDVDTLGRLVGTRSPRNGWREVIFAWR